MNLAFAIANIIGGRAFLNFVTGRYHSPVTDNRYVLFVDIAGSTGLAESLGGLAIHRLRDRAFRLLTLSVVDYRGEVLNYVGDEVIVTWPERDGAIDCRPLRCFVAMRNELAGAALSIRGRADAIDVMGIEVKA
jgi:adenylate cyclase